MVVKSKISKKKTTTKKSHKTAKTIKSTKHVKPTVQKRNVVYKDKPIAQTRSQVVKNVKTARDTMMLATEREIAMDFATKIYKEFDAETQLIRIERLGPSDKTINAFASDLAVPNDNLSYRSNRKQGQDQVSLQDAKLLHLRVTYWYPLYVPFVNKLIFNTFICHKKTPGFSGKWDTDPVCTDMEQDPVIPLTATAVMRMQTPLVNSSGYYTAD